MSNSINKETFITAEEIATRPTDPAIATALFQTELIAQNAKFKGLMTATAISNPGTYVPKPRQIQNLATRIYEIGLAQQSAENQQQQAALRLQQQAGIGFEAATDLVKAGQIMSQEILRSGLTYRDEPFNLALLPPQEISTSTADQISQVVFNALNATQQLIINNPQARFLVEKGSTTLERNLNRQLPAATAPLNRMDLIGGQIIEFGPTYTDGFGTAQTLAKVWGIPGNPIQTLANTLLRQYDRGQPQPSLGLAYIGASLDMVPELEIVRDTLATDSRFGSVAIYQFEEALRIKPNILYYYFKPSMLDRAGYTIDDLLTLNQTTCLVPPLNEQLGKKVILAMFSLFSTYYRQILGPDQYQSLMDLVVPTTLVTPDTQLPDYACVLKPSSGGSNDGVIDNTNPIFETIFRQSQNNFNDPLEDAWVIQPKLSNNLPTVFGSSNGSIVTITNANIRTVLLTGLSETGQPLATGGFAAADSDWVIADNGFNFPVKLKGGRQ